MRFAEMASRKGKRPAMGFARAFFIILRNKAAKKRGWKD